MRSWTTSRIRQAGKWVARELSRHTVATTLLILLCPLGLVAGVVAWHTYEDVKTQRTETEQRRLLAIATATVEHLDGDLHEAWAREFETKDALSDWSQAPADLMHFQRTLHRLAVANGLPSPIYTMRICENARARVEAEPDRLHRDALEFIITSHATPYWRHKYDYRPEMKAAFFNGQPTWTGTYDDQHGSWVSAYAPLRNKAGQVVGLLEADMPLDNLEAAVMQAFGTRLLPLGVYFVMCFLLVLGLVAAARHVEKSARMLAEQGSRAKSEFLANMSHEIRTPMTAILGYCDLLQDDATSVDARRDALRTIRRNGRHLLELINDILDLSRIEAGKLTLESLDVSPCGIVAEVASLMQVRAQEKQLSLELDFPTSLPRQVKTDPTRLRQVLVNLVGNAIKFTERGEVRITTRLVPGSKPTLSFEVRDTGMGMTGEQAELIFTMFAQADYSVSRRFGGSGLGLTISRRMSQALGGDLELVESRPGQGSLFRFTIAAGEYSESDLVERPSACVVHRPEEPVAKTPADQLDGLRVLLVEDGADNQRLIVHLLRRAGAEVDLAEDGQQALDRIAKVGHYDVVLMDMQMPVMDGYTATRKLRERSYSGPIIALTAHAMAGDRERCLQAGCNDYATKPIDRRHLVQLVAQHARQFTVS